MLGQAQQIERVSFKPSVAGIDGDGRHGAHDRLFVEYPSQSREIVHDPVVGALRPAIGGEGHVQRNSRLGIEVVDRAGSVQEEVAVLFPYLAARVSKHVQMFHYPRLPRLGVARSEAIRLNPQIRDMVERRCKGALQVNCPEFLLLGRSFPSPV